ncbi:nucleotidyltransferase [Aminipila luticellarii]|uniref:tRNA(Met) cytidine acetate ligase n=1 Tax=Aminipila luticellarii TaxID=2507160 RepID=A0A410PV38_9FIRM|nr:nucleotidyltransferase [Aminipila luticellarii]QAT42812.1 nucleotidyltransferase [Aminipila luticellarii]
MKVLGIIAEYNPFHNGHLYQLNQSAAMTEADFVVAIISGNFTQRGEAAVLSKWARAEMAVRCGIDLVIELPFAFACNNAEYFAKGAIEILNRLRCVTHLSFGSESGDLERLKEVACFLSHETEEFKDQLKSNLSKGFSYPKARSEAVKECLGEEASENMLQPNNILAIEYLKQLYLTHSDIIPVTVKRYASNYHDQELRGNIASASAIRKALHSNDWNTQLLESAVPAEVLAILQKELPKAPSSDSEELYFKLAASKILTEKNSCLKEIFSVTEGLENKLKASIRISDTLGDLKNSLKSKRYTSTRISRLLTHILIGLTKSDFNTIVETQQYYAHILGFNKKGAHLLKLLKQEEKATLPLITNINKQADALNHCQLLLSYDLIASDFYNLLSNQNIYEHSDRLYKPYMQL